MNIYGRIDELLQEKKLSRRKLAAMAKIPPTTLQSAFGRKSKGLSFDYLQKIADTLDVSVGYLLGSEEDDGDNRFREVRDILEDFDFIVEQDEHDETCGVVRINHEEKNIATVVNVHDLITIVDEVMVDEEEEKERQIKKRLIDIFGGKGK